MKNLNIRPGGKYKADVAFDSIKIAARECDLSTAVEYLMVLTCIKQKMAHAGEQRFEEQFREAVVSSCTEHGVSFQEMGLTFCVAVSARSFLGKTTMKLGENMRKQA